MKICVVVGIFRDCLHLIPATSYCLLITSLHRTDALTSHSWMLRCDRAFWRITKCLKGPTSKRPIISVADAAPLFKVLLPYPFSFSFMNYCFWTNFRVARTALARRRVLTNFTILISSEGAQVKEAEEEGRGSKRRR